MNNYIFEVEKTLKDVFEKYSQKFDIRSMYIWGSILTPDYIICKSDIDTIAIVDDSVPMSLENEMLNELKGKIPEVEKFSIRFLYISELNGGKIKGNLASYIDARLLLLDFTNWTHVAGQQYSVADFSLQVPTFDEAIALHMKKAQEKGWLDVNAVSERDNMYFLKNLVQSIYMIERKKGLKSPFSYKLLSEFASGREAEIFAHIVESRENGWNYSTFLKHKNSYQKYLDAILIK
jgi:hypothetical protein